MKLLHPATHCPVQRMPENEEPIEVHLDGSVSVTVQAMGTPTDLAVDGYPVPLSGAFVPHGPLTERWVELIGPDTGSPATIAAVASALRAVGIDDMIDFDVLAAEARA